MSVWKENVVWSREQQRDVEERVQLAEAAGHQISDLGRRGRSTGLIRYAVTLDACAYAEADIPVELCSR